MSRSDGLEAVRERRDDLEALAESNLRCAKYAQALLDAADDADAQSQG